jgi:hypothetical protein
MFSYLKGFTVGKYLGIITLCFFLSACNSVNSLNENIKEFTGVKEKMTSDSCTNLSYISNINDKEYGQLFIEYISLDNSCSWNSFQRGNFESLFKSTLKLKSMRAVERIDYKNYEFSTYIIDDKYYLNLVYKYSTFEDLFILDYEGKYYTTLRAKFDNTYTNDYLDKLRFKSDYSKSLVSMNFINSYFSRDAESMFDK